MPDDEKAKIYCRDEAAARMTAEPGKVMACGDANCYRYIDGRFNRWDYERRRWTHDGHLPFAKYVDSPDPRNPRYSDRRDEEYICLTTETTDRHVNS